MAYGFQSINDSGIVQISDSYLHLHVLQSGTIASNASTYTTINFPDDGFTAIPMVNGWGAAVYRMSSTQIRVYAPHGANYVILSTAPIPAGESVGYGLQVNDASGNIIYSSAKRIFTIDNFYQATLEISQFDESGPKGFTSLTTPSGKNRYISATWATAGAVGVSPFGTTWPVFFGASATSAQVFWRNDTSFPFSIGDDDRSGLNYRYGFFTGYCSV